MVATPSSAPRSFLLLTKTAEEAMDELRNLPRELEKLSDAAAAKAELLSMLATQCKNVLSSAPLRNANHDDLIQCLNPCLYACQKQREADPAAVSGWLQIQQRLVAFVQRSIPPASAVSVSDGDHAPHDTAVDLDSSLDLGLQQQGGSIPDSACEGIAPSCNRLRDEVQDDIAAHEATEPQSPPSEADSLEKKRVCLRETYEQRRVEREQAKELYRYMEPPDGESYESLDERLENELRVIRRELKGAEAAIRARDVALIGEHKSDNKQNITEDNIATQPNHIRYTPLAGSESAESTPSSAQTFFGDEAKAEWIQALDSAMQQFTPPLIVPAPCDHFYWTFPLGGPDPPPYDPPPRSRTFPITFCTPCFTRISAIRKPTLSY
ncbi:hypothetical protein LTR97_011058 [Elasticomyces elasticus]|uniref:Uncharacterized protein n=1 Tax=Elasticomyces elasticus TaxID=574655 RepID=A0AAN7ZL53_9PEZI|nr:hypothetical protein LTR97_011058 [Elasticomyces elasticus]